MFRSFIIFSILQYGAPAINLAELSLQPMYQQRFIEQPQNLTVIEGESVTLKCKIENLGGKVQWSTDGFAMGYKLETIKSYCSKCAPRGNTNKGEYHLYVEDVELGRYNEFECQVSPDHSNAHQALRARATLNVIVPPSRVELVGTERRISMNAGTEKQLSCRASGAKPQAKIVWYHGHNKILDQEYSKQITNGHREGTWDTVNTLKFKATSADDGIPIRCVVEHPALKGKPMEKEIALTVFYPPGEPRIVGDTKQAFRQGEMINITCISSGGNPPPYVSWFKDNIQLQYPHTKLENGSTVSHLFIRADQTLLTDVYNCKAWNKETSIALPSKNVKFNVTFSGDRVHIRGPESAQIGSELTLQCSSEESNPPSVIKWLVDGVERRGTQEEVAVSQGGWRTTSVIKLRVDVNLSQMKVTCSAINNLFEDKFEETKIIKILRPPEAPSISGLPAISLREGNNLTLSCISRHGSPLPMLKWFKQGEYIPSQSYSLVEDTYQDSYAISKLFLIVSRTDNDMQYSCEASNGEHFPTISQKTNFSVYFEPRDARLYLSMLGTAEGGPEVAHSTAGDRVQLNCQSSNSNPPAKITWFKNGNEVRGGAIDVKPGKYGGVRMSQVFKINEGNPITSEDNGSRFSCTASNPAINGNNVTKQYILNVRYPPEFSVASPGNYSVIEGEDIIMRVESKGNPPVRRYSWYTGLQPHKPLLADSLPKRFKIGGPTLEIRKTIRNDAGLYIFGAENDIGEKNKEIYLDVLYHPTIINLTAQIIADEGDKAVFQCIVDANPISPKTVSWRVVGDRKFNFTERAIFDYDGNMTFSMTIPNVRKTDRGKFYCIADNHLLHAQPDERQTVLKVNFRPEIRKFPRYAKFAQNLMHQINLECIAYGYPNVSIVWKKAGDLDAERYTFDNRGVTKQLDYGTWKSTLKIESVLNSDYTVYQCVANNTLGQDRHNISLTSPNIPDPPLNLEVKMVDYKTVRLKWEPGFDGGFQQQFVTRVKEVKTGKVTTQRSEHSRMDRDSEFVTQDIIIQPNVEYAFSVKAVNVQGDSDFSEEKLKALKASENKAKDESAVPRVIIVAIVLGSILFVIIKLMIITCCIKQRKENRRREEKKHERSSSLSSKRSMMIERYPPSKYANAFGADMFISPPSNSGSTISDSHEPPDYKYLARSLSMPGQDKDSDRGYTSYAGSCSVHGTLKRHISSGIDTTMEDDVFDDYSAGADFKENGGPGFPVVTADRMLKGGRGRSRAGSLSSPTHIPAPRLGVSGLYTDHMERRKYSMAGSISPPNIPSPPPPVNTSTLGRKHQFPPPPLPNMLHCNGHINMIDANDKKSAVEISNELTRRITELGRDRSVEPPDALGHLKLNNLPELPVFSTQPATRKYYDSRPNNASHFM